MSANRKPILALDFDGVIHSYASGWKGAHVIPDPPVPGAIPYLLTALDSFEVAIFSSRSKNPLGRWAMKRWLANAIREHWEAGGNEPSLAECECWGDAAGIHRRFSWPWFKPAALVTLDDRALTFDGTWPDLDTLASFRPWNKLPAVEPIPQHEGHRKVAAPLDRARACRAASIACSRFGEWVPQQWLDLFMDAYESEAALTPGADHADAR